MIKVTDLCFSHPQQNTRQFRLSSMSFKIKRGEIVALIGPSGSGKTTLLRCLNGLYKALSGHIYITGLDITKCSESALRKFRRQVGMVFQGFNLLQRGTVLENVLWGRLGWTRTLGNYDKSSIDSARRSIRQVGLSAYENSRVDKLSGGQQQRVGIARALTQSPEIMLADEPVSNLDIKTKEEILKLLLKINGGKKITTIVSVHNLDIIRGLIDRVIAISGGRIVYDGNTKSLTKRKLNEIFI